MKAKALILLERAAIRLPFIATYMLAVNLSVVYFTADWFYTEILYYYEIGQHFFIRGDIPYVAFGLEHPPGAFLYFFFLFLLSLNWFPLIYPILNRVFVVATALRFQLLRLSQITDILLLFLMSPYIFARYDVFPMLASFFSYLTLFTGRYLVSGLLLGLGIITKIYPLFLLPMSCIVIFMQPKDCRLKKGIRFFIGLCLGVGLPLLLLLFFKDPSIFRGIYDNVVAYHADRGVQSESLIGSFYLLFHVNSYHNLLVHNYGSWNIREIPSVVVTVITVFQVTGIGLIYMSFYKAIKNGVANLANTYLLFVIELLLIVILLSKVFSPQYLLWPFLFILALIKKERGAPKTCQKITMWWLIISCLTYVLIIVYGSFLAGKPILLVLLCVRNISVAILIWIIVRVIRKNTIHFNTHEKTRN